MICRARNNINAHVDEPGIVSFAQKQISPLIDTDKKNQFFSRYIRAKYLILIGVVSANQW